jgi:hypothetical protein
MSYEVGHIENDPVSGVDATNKQAIQSAADDKAAANAIENDERAAEEMRFQEQCFLLRAITNPILGKHLKNPTQRYGNFIKVTAQDPTTVINNLTATRGADEVLTINQKEIALLQPMIRIFKVSEKNNATIESEYRFDEGSFISVGEEYSTQSFFADGNTRGRDVGLESVSFEWMGTQPAEVSNNIRCTIKLFFQNMKALMQPRKDPNSDEYYRYADLILRPPGKVGVDQYKPEHYRIKLVVGWSKPPEYNTGVIRPEVADALVRTRTVLNLTLKNHTFDFKMDGTSTLEIEYHAWAEGALSHPATDLFYPTDADAKKLKQLEAAEDYTKTQKKFIQQNTGVNKSPTEGDGALPTPGDPPEKTTSEQGTDKNLEKLQEAKKTLQNQIRANAYSRFLNTLLYSPTSNIYYIDVTAAQLGKVKTSDDADDQPQSKQVDAKGKKTKCSDLVMDTNINGGLLSPNNATGLSKGRVKPGEGLSADAKENIKDAVGETAAGDLRGEGSGGSAEDYAKATLGYLQPGLSPKDNGALRVNFFYFGDLLNMCLSILHGLPEYKPGGSMKDIANRSVQRALIGEGSAEFKNSPASKVDIMTGPLYLSNPCTNEQIPMNLADVPISVNLFTQWFMNNVIRRQAPTYLLRKFIDDLIGTLLPAALGEGCVEGAGRSLIRMQSNVLNIKGVDNKPPFKRGMVVSAKAVSNIAGAMDWTGQVQPKNTYDYLFLYAIGFSPNHLGGNKEMDRKNGIYHFKLGSDEGILKSISFDKADAPYLGEMKVTGKNNIANDLGGGGIYNAKMELVGNSLFVPGQYVFIDPSALGTGHPAADGTDGVQQSVAYRMRLGGYYFIHKVESTLERGNFTTSIEAKFESGGGKSEPPPPTAAETLDKKLSDEAKAGFKLAEVEEGEYNNPEEAVSWYDDIF